MSSRWGRASGPSGRGRARAEAGVERAAEVRRSQGARDSIESFVIVLMAFLLWSIQAEGFVIPTGSMAPTLMGRHKEITCPECGYVYTVNADREVEPDPRGRDTDHRITWGTCENCRFEANVADAPSFSGDRIYVMKQGLALPFFERAGQVRLRRWEVAVFKLPEEPDIRYIKRLVGMPDEVLRIQGGDVWVAPKEGTGPFERPMRPLEHQQAMQVTVYDDRHRPASLADDPAWRRWAPVEEGAWTEPVAGRFVSAASAEGWAELRYRHLVLSPEQWQAIRQGSSPGEPRPRLITDYSSYNTDVMPHDRDAPLRAARPWFQPHWVGDLTLSMRLTVTRPAGRLRVDLIRAGRVGRCEIDLTSGEARLSCGGRPVGQPTKTGLLGPGEAHDLVFANVDGRLTLWVDGELPFGEGVCDPADPGPAGPTADDLTPARLSAQGAAVAIEQLVLKRDAYYTLEPSESDYTNLGGDARFNPSAFFRLLSEPEQFSRLVCREPRDYPIAAGRYLMLGDNSPWSRDARAWGRIDQIDPSRPDRGWDDSGRASWEVPEGLLVGKAFCVYWPHLQPVWPRIRLAEDIRLPALPYIQRMRWIR